MHIGYERIHPTPAYPIGLSAAGLATFAWTSRAKDVLKFKNFLKDRLRAVQNGRCCYCRRLLSDPMTTDLEHFIEKSVCPWLTFETKNLALSCRTCNSKKNELFLRLCSHLSRGASATAGVSIKVQRCPTLVAPLAPLAPLPADSSAYRWIHPHFDDFSSHVTIQKGWIFSWKSAKGFRTIRGMQLNALAQIERRALAERLAACGGPLSILVGAVAELNHASASDVCAGVAAELRRRLRARNAIH